MSKYTLYIGTYTHGGKSKGIYVYEADCETGRLTLLGTQWAEEPSYIKMSDDGKTLYSVQETMAYAGEKNSGSAMTFAIQGDELLPQAVYPTHGGAPCYISGDGSHMFVANYMGGNVAVYALKDGVLQGEAQMLNRSGTGPNAQRQEAPHAHFSLLTPDEKYLAVCDLGTDSVAMYPYCPCCGAEDSPIENRVDPGDGPRHLAFSPCGKYAYLVCELTAVVYAFRYENGRLSRLQRIEMLEKAEGLRRAAAAIRVSPDGKFVYATNRFTDRICIFAVQGDGTLELVESMPLPFVNPRDINFLPGGKFLLVACETGNTLAVYSVCQDCGKLTFEYSLEIPNAVCACIGNPR